MKKLIETPGGKIAYCGMLTALAMIFSYVESLIPINFGVPGIKLGLANLVVLTGLYWSVSCSGAEYQSCIHSQAGF